MYLGCDMKWLIVLLSSALVAAAVNLPQIPIDFNVDDKILSDMADNVAEALEKGYITYLKTGVETPEFRKLTTQLANSHSKRDLFTKEISELDTRDSFVVCSLCRATVRVMARTIREEDGELYGPHATEWMKDFAMDVCRRLNLQTDEVCSGLIDSHVDAVEYIMRNSEIDSQNFCALFMEYNFCNTGSNIAYNWTLTVESPSEPLTGSRSDTPRHSANDLKICHFSDIHHDPLYEPGSLATCVEPICCQRHKDIAEGTSDAAGFWGDYRECDLPWRVVESALENIAATVDCDLVYQTGDTIDHMVWATSIEKNTGVLAKVTDAFTKTFGNVPVYSCIGNHEPHPLNLPEDVPENINTYWLYEFLHKDWMLPEETKETFLRGGYYTLSPRPGLRIISLNSNDCYSDNYWLYHSGTNKIPQLEWFCDVLAAAEKANEFVHILSHIPSGGGSCWSVWAREYNRCVTRYHKVISGIFNGHSHKDEMMMQYSDEGYATAVVWNGGALTTSNKRNSNYRVYDVDPETFYVTNHRTYIYNLTDANLHPDENPKWYLEYEFIKEFTEDTSPAGIDKLLDDFADNPELLRKYWLYRVTSADPAIEEGCDRNCLGGILCRTSVAVNTNRELCEERRRRLYIALDNEASSSTTTRPTEKPEDEDDDGGASAMSALSLTTLLLVVMSLRASF